MLCSLENTAGCFGGLGVLVPLVVVDVSIQLNYRYRSGVTLQSRLEDQVTGTVICSGTFPGRGEVEVPEGFWTRRGRGHFQRAFDESMIPAMAQANNALITSLARCMGER